MESDSDDDDKYPSYYGTLKKRNKHVWGDSYSSRFFTLSQNVLCYFEKREQSAKCSVKEYVRRYKPKAVYDLDGASVSTSGANFLTLEFSDGRRLDLHCVDVKDRDKWASKIGQSIKATHSPGVSPAPASQPRTRANSTAPSRSRSPPRSRSKQRQGKVVDHDIPDRLLTSAIVKLLRDAQRMNPGWKLVQAGNGLRIFEDVSSSNTKFPTFKAIGVVYAPPADVFKLMMDQSELRTDWDLTFNKGTIIKDESPNSDIVRVETQEIHLFPLWADPREFCFYRYWKREQDGSYTVILSPPNTVVPPGVNGNTVKADLLGGCILITASDDDENSSVVTYALQIDPKAFQPVYRLHESIAMLTALAFSWFCTSALEGQPFLQLGAVVVMMSGAFCLFGREIICAILNILITPRMRKLYLSAFHIQMLVAVAGLRDMINQTPGLDNILSDTSQVGAIWESDNQLPRKRGTGSCPVEEPEEQKVVSAKIERAVMPQSSKEIFDRLEALADKHSWFGKGPIDLSGSNCWASIPCMGDFSVRGPNYLTDRKKMPSDGTLMPVVCVELLPCANFQTNICAHKKGFVQKVQKSWGDTDAPFIFCVSFFVPCSPDNYMLNIYSALDPAIDPNSKPVRVLQKFMDGDKESQDKKFKLIPRVAEGSWIVRKACGDPPTPAIMGNKVNQICTKGKGYFEVDFNLGDSAVAGGIIKIVLGPAKSLIVDLAFLVETQTPEEMPEKLLTCVRMARVDLLAANERKNPYESVAFNIGRR